MTKHEQIINYIKDLSIGSKISVRQIAQELSVSDGTAYRAIKEAENEGWVDTIPRVGTVRKEKAEKKNIEKLTFAEIVNIVDGSVLGGRSGLHKTLNKFIIGAMEIDAMKRYIEPNNLLIVGNREPAQKLALDMGAAILITGGFDTSHEIKEFANAKGLPVISSSYDTFTIATMINRAIYDRLIKKDIVLVEDIMVTEPHFLTEKDTVNDWKHMLKVFKHSRYPVVDSENKVIGIATTKDIAGHDSLTPINKVMTKGPITLTKQTSVAYAAHVMVWEGIELIPVTEDKRLIGVVSRQDVIKAIQHMQKQPQIAETVEDTIISQLEEITIKNGVKLSGKITPVMLNHRGTASCGAVVSMMAYAGIAAVRTQKHYDVVTDNFNVYFLKPIQLDQKIEITAHVIDLGRKTSKLDIELRTDEKLVAKAFMSARVLER